jgi:hypothetical protein
MDPSVATKANGFDSLYVRERDLMTKLHDLLRSPLGNGVACIVDELHTLIPRSRTSI